MGIIYKLLVGDFWYVGKTINSFKSRYNQHKSMCFNKNKKDYNSKKYIIMRKMGVSLKNWNDKVKYEIIFEGDNKWLYCYENLSIKLDDPWCINTLCCKIDKIEPVEVNRWGTMTKDMIKEQGKKYREEHKEQIKIYRESRKEYYKKYNEKYYNDNKKQRLEQMKKYNNNNKEQIKKNSKKYYENNKNYMCSLCKTKKLGKGDYNKHCKTKKHLKHLKNKL
tara:strand:- start:496 stop:1158 length:663 start_codon:yes stop_codon:yes gene_type:complete